MIDDELMPYIVYCLYQYTIYSLMIDDELMPYIAYCSYQYTIYVYTAVNDLTGHSLTEMHNGQDKYIIAFILL